MSTASHWNNVYDTKAASDVSWYQGVPATSMRLIRGWAPSHDTIVDVGAGASTLVDWLVRERWSDVTVLDASSSAIELVRQRIGDAAGVTFVNADLRHWEPGHQFDVWHDRAVFHFLVEAADRDRYVSLVTRWIRPGGVLIVATFATDGPQYCSGLPTARYDAVDLESVFGDAFRLEHAEREEHSTPQGALQPFTWVVLRRVDSTDS